MSRINGKKTYTQNTTYSLVEKQVEYEKAGSTIFVQKSAFPKIKIWSRLYLVLLIINKFFYHPSLALKLLNTFSEG